MRRFKFPIPSSRSREALDSIISVASIPEYAIFPSEAADGYRSAESGLTFYDLTIPAIPRLESVSAMTRDTLICTVKFAFIDRRCE